MRVCVCTSEYVYIGMCRGQLGFILYSWHVSNRKLQEQIKNLVQKILFLFEICNIIILFLGTLYMHVGHYVLTRNVTCIFCLLSILYNNSNLLHAVDVLSRVGWYA
jgi:hypothetical protein